MLGQLVFGYDEGHRLIGGSRQLESRTLAMLLGATDASPGSDGRLVTAMPLRSEGLFAMCFTWRAPEVSRPGAVWSHVLLAPLDFVENSPEPFAVADFARRPTPSSLKSYQQDLAVSIDDLEQRMPDATEKLLEAVFAAAFVASNDAIVVEANLEDAERAIAAAWRIQWPALRSRFSFRTRDAVRDSKRADVTVARRLRGPSRQRTQLVKPPWIAELARESRSETPDAPLIEFIQEFGAFDAAEVGAIGRLADVYTAIRTGTAGDISDAVGAAYPTPVEGQQLKRVLFGGEIPDPMRRRAMLVSLLGSGIDGWDAFELHLPEQIASLITELGTEAFAGLLAPVAGSGVRRATLLALAQRSEPSDVAILARSHLDLVVELLRESPDLLEDDAAWRDIPASVASALLAATTPPSQRVVAAATRAGHAAAVLSVLGPELTLKAVAEVADYPSATAVAGVVPWQEILEVAMIDDRVAILAAAVAVERSLPRNLLEALENERSRHDELWLRAAVTALASSKLSTRSVLPVVFGPLHEAMTSNRLPHECWAALDVVLPESSDPAQRLRRFLVSEARHDQWSASEFERAIADAGPFTSQLEHDYADHDEDWYVSVAKTVLRALGRFGR